MSEFLLELYSEEIPPLLQINAREHLKVELQKFVFPKGTTYDKENKRVRTPEVNLLFELTKQILVSVFPISPIKYILFKLIFQNCF